MNSILNEDSTDVFVDDKIVRFICATNRKDKSARPPSWWKENSERFPHIARKVRRHFTIQASLVARESIPSLFRNSIVAEITRLPEALLTACMCVFV